MQVRILEKTHKSDHPDTLTALDSLTSAMSGLGGLEETYEILPVFLMLGDVSLAQKPLSCTNQRKTSLQTTRREDILIQQSISRDGRLMES